MSGWYGSSLFLFLEAQSTVQPEKGLRQTVQRSVIGPDPQGASGSVSALTGRVARIAEPLLRSLGLELFDLCFSSSQRGGRLQVFINKQEGVSLGDCEKFSRLLGPALDVDDLIPENYILEVSSPGLDRPLREKADYRQFIGKRVRIKTVLKIENQKYFVGKLVDFDGETVALLTDEQEKREIPFHQIARAHLDIEWSAGK